MTLHTNLYAYVCRHLQLGTEDSHSQSISTQILCLLPLWTAIPHPSTRALRQSPVPKHRTSGKGPDCRQIKDWINCRVGARKGGTFGSSMPSAPPVSSPRDTQTTGQSSSNARSIFCQPEQHLLLGNLLSQLPKDDTSREFLVLYLLTLTNKFNFYRWIFMS